MTHSDNRITEKPVPSIGEWSDVCGVWGSAQAWQRVQEWRHSGPHKHPTIILSPGGGESPPGPVAKATPKAEPHSDRREASSSLESSTPNAHTEGGKALGVPCGGWLREVCGHGNVRWVLLHCHKWQCDSCGPGKHMELLERLRGAFTLAQKKGWTLKFVTLTWVDDVTKKQVRLDLAHMVQAIRRKYGYCEYAKVPEWTQNGRIHLHLAMVMPFIPQRVLSAMWKAHSQAPIAWITAVQDINRLKNELAKYLTKGPAGKVTYSRNFPKAELVQVKTGVCDACEVEHRFEFLTERWAVQEYPLEEHGRLMPGEPVFRVMCGCWALPGDDGFS